MYVIMTDLNAIISFKVVLFVVFLKLWIKIHFLLKITINP